MSQLQSPCPTVAGATCIDVANVTGAELEFVMPDGTAVPGAPKIDPHSRTNVGFTGTLAVGSLNVVRTSDKVLMARFPPEDSTVLIISESSERPSLKTYKSFVFWVPIVGFLVTAIIALVLNSHLKRGRIQEFCTKFESSEACIEAIETGQMPNPNSTGLIAAGTISAILGFAFLGLWLFSAGPLGFASYSQCRAKTGFGSTWNWVMPRSGFHKFMCKVFGVCECAADGLAQECEVYSILEGGNDFAWNESAASKSSSKTNICFCCDKDGKGCVDVERNAPCQ